MKRTLIAMLSVAALVAFMTPAPVSAQSSPVTVSLEILEYCEISGIVVTDGGITIANGDLTGTTGVVFNWVTNTTSMDIKASIVGIGAVGFWEVSALDSPQTHATGAFGITQAVANSIVIAPDGLGTGSLTLHVAVNAEDGPQDVANAATLTIDCTPG